MINFKKVTKQVFHWVNETCFCSPKEQVKPETGNERKIFLHFWSFFFLKEINPKLILRPLNSLQVLISNKDRLALLKFRESIDDRSVIDYIDNALKVSVISLSMFSSYFLLRCRLGCALCCRCSFSVFFCFIRLFWMRAIRSCCYKKILKIQSQKLVN